jgi:hypothetical protein
VGEDHHGSTEAAARQACAIHLRVGLSQFHQQIYLGHGDFEVIPHGSV